MSELSFKRKRKKHINFEPVRIILLWALQIMAVSALAAGIVWAFGTKVKISGGMAGSGLKNGDTALINRLSRRRSGPERGDIIAYMPDGDGKSVLRAGRIMALPGETVSEEEGKLLINGRGLSEKYTGDIDISDDVLPEPVTLSSGEYLVMRGGADDGESVYPYVTEDIEKDFIKGKIWFVASPFSHFGFVRN